MLPAWRRRATPSITGGGPMDNKPEQRDEEIRATIDELNEAHENVRRVREEGEHWQQENPPPNRPHSVKSMAEIDRFDDRNNTWNKQYRERRERLEKAQARLHAAQEKLVSLLPEQIGYEYKGKRYQREGGSYRTDRIG
jgi:chromosome segregation ATPase